MRLSGWMVKRKVKKWGAVFSDYIRHNEFGSALELYHKNLRPLEKDLPHSLKSLYLFCRWFDSRSDKDFVALQKFSQTAGDGGAAVKASAVAERMRSQQRLTEALKQQNNSFFDEALTTGISTQFHSFERLGLATGAVLFLISSGHDAGLKDKVADFIRAVLPPREDIRQKTAQEVYDHLDTWSRITRREYDAFMQTSILRQLPKKDRRPVLKTAVSVCGTRALINGDIKKTQRIYNHGLALKAFTSEQAYAMALSWTISGLEQHKSEEVDRWVASLLMDSETFAGKAWVVIFILARAVAVLQKGDALAGDATLKNILKKLRANSDGEIQLNKKFACRSLISLIKFLQGLQLLSGTRDWIYPGKINDEKEKAAALMRNRSLWSELRATLDPLIKNEINVHTDQTWRWYLLRGLLLFVDRRSAIDMNDINKFSQAIENVESKKARTRFKSIQGTLITRAKAADEAVAMIRANDVDGLRVLQRDVLEPLGDGLPPVLRATVLMVLWEADPATDPIDLLRRLPRSHDDEKLIDACILTIKSAQTIRELSCECRLLTPSNRTLPSIELLTGMSPAMHLCSLAVSVVLLRRREWSLAITALQTAIADRPDELGELFAIIQFYSAWKSGDMALCRDVYEHNREIVLFMQNPGVPEGILVRSLLSFLDPVDKTNALKVIGELAAQKDWKSLQNCMISLAIRLMERNQARKILTLVEFFETYVKINALPQAPAIEWIASLLRGFALGRLKHYNACIKEFDAALAAFPSDEQFIFAGDQLKCITQWIQLFRCVAELAVTAESDDDIKSRLPALRRIMGAQAAELNATPNLSAYGSLITGLATFLSTNMIVPEEVIQQLSQAQHQLALGKKRAVIEMIIGKLSWRMRVLNDFWAAVAGGRFKKSYTLYMDELAQGFGRNIPPPVQLAMVMVEWDLAKKTAGELLSRLAEIESEAADLNPELIKKVKTYILDGEKTRHMTKLLKEQEYNEFIDFFKKQEWNKGIPVSVVIGLLFSFYKTRRIDEAKNLMDNIRGSKGLALWVKNYSHMLLGYVLFESQDFKNAAEVFGEVGQSQLLGHDLDKYWAAAQFSNGIQLLEVDRKDEAFDAFARSMRKRSAVAKNDPLISLFLHFGLKNLETHNGARAKQSFRLVQEGLSSQSKKTEEDITVNFISEIGISLCDALMEGKKEDVEADIFLSPLYKLQGIRKNPLSQIRCQALERVSRKTAVCQALRREYRYKDTPEKRKKESWLNKFLTEQINALNAIDIDQENNDPVLWVLKGLLEINFSSKGNAKQAMEWFTLAARLGAESPRLARLINHLIQSDQKALKQHNALLDIFDAYLISDDVPDNIKKAMVRSDDISVLYRLNRRYVPHDIRVRNAKSGMQVMCRRVEDIIYYIRESEMKNDPEMIRTCDALKKEISDAHDLENRVLLLEQKLIQSIAQKMQKQHL